MTLRATLHRTLAALATTAALLVTAVPAGAAPAPSPTPDAAPAGAAPAADGGFRWAVQPSSKEGPTGRNYFVYDLAPGDRITDYVGISNLGTEPMTFSVYGTDAFTTDDGSFALLPASDKPTDVGSWIKFAQGRYTVQPGQRLDIPFRLTVPANATPGDHAGGVIGALAQIETDAAGQRINVDRRIAARVYLRVAGNSTPPSRSSRSTCATTTRSTRSAAARPSSSTRSATPETSASAAPARSPSPARSAGSWPGPPRANCPSCCRAPPSPSPNGSPACCPRCDSPPRSSSTPAPAISGWSR